MLHSPDHVYLLVLTEAGVGPLGGGALPPAVPVVGQAGLAVVPRGAVLAQADAAALGVLGVTGNISSGKYLSICKKYL